jgi:hypothetical protein
MQRKDGNNGMVKAALSGLLVESNKFDSPKRTLPRGGPTEIQKASRGRSLLL